jgi:hypothetical protein
MGVSALKKPSHGTDKPVLKKALLTRSFENILKRDKSTSLYCKRQTQTPHS